MRTLLALALLALTSSYAAAFAPNDPWTKVHELKSGAELRIFKKGVRQPVLATYEDLNDDSLIIATKTEEVAIPKDQIDRIDFRPKPESRVTKETRTTVTDPDPASPPNHSAAAAQPGSSTSTNFSFGSKPDFQTIYRAGQR